MNNLSRGKRLFLLVVLLLSLLSFVLAAATPEFPRTCLKVGNRMIEVKVAKAMKALQEGLSELQSLAEDEGMFFVFPKGPRLIFHRRRIFIPLSIAFVDGKGRILKIEDMEPKDQDKLYPSPEHSRYALEMNRGWFEKNGVKPGDVIRGNRKKLKSAEHCPAS